MNYLKMFYQHLFLWACACAFCWPVSPPPRPLFRRGLTQPLLPPRRRHLWRRICCGNVSAFALLNGPADHGFVSALLEFVPIKRSSYCAANLSRDLVHIHTHTHSKQYNKRVNFLNFKSLK